MENKISFHGCKYLCYDREKIDSRIRIKSLPVGIGAYWERDKDLLPDSSCAVNVQFCLKRGRLNSKVSCLAGHGECNLYEDVLHLVDTDGVLK